MAPSDSLDRLEQLFRAALQRPSDEWAAYLEHACPDDPALRDEVLTLLRADADADSAFVLDQPPFPWDGDLPDDDPSATDIKGQSIGPYTLHRRLGHGGMGEVFLAVREEPFQQLVALKVIRPGLAVPETLQRFHMERQILAALNHPHIARLLDGGMTPDGRPYLVMEYVAGKPITTYCDEHQLDVDARLRLFQTVCEAVQYAHQSLIIHRDLKPSNILVTADGQVKLLDFGIAKLLDPDLSPVTVPVTRTELRLMTPEYASPEQVRGEGLTTTTDVYSLGVILYELLTGHRPYRLTQRTPAALMAAVCEQEPLRPSTRVGKEETITYADGGNATILPKDVSGARAATTDRLRRRLRGDLDNIVLMALRKEPERRYGSVEQFGQDVGRYLRGEPVLAQPNTTGYRLRKFVHRHRWGVGTLSLLFLLLLGFGLAMSALSVRLTRERDKAVQVSSFLEDLFKATNPYAALPDTMRIRDFLDEGTAKVQRDLQAQPAVQAHLLRVLGNVYRRLGTHDRADTLLTQALARYREVYGEEHAEVATTLRVLALLRKDQGRAQDAEPLLREALAIQDRAGGVEPLDRASALHDLAEVLRAQAAYAAAQPLYEEALAIRERLLPPNDPQLGVTYHNLAMLYRMHDELPRADSLMRNALAINRTHYGPNHPTVANDLNNLAHILNEQDSLDAAIVHLHQALAINRRHLGEAHPEVATNLYNLGAMLRKRGNLDTAEVVIRQVLELDRQLMGDAHPNVAMSMMNLANLLQDKGDLTAAETLYTAAHTRLTTALGPTHPYVARCASGLAGALIKQGRYAEAAAFYREALTIFEERFKPDHTLVVQAREDLARLYEAWGKPEEAAAYRTASPGRGG